MLTPRQEAKPLPPLYTQVTAEQLADLKAELRREVLAELRPFLVQLLAPPPPPPEPDVPATDTSCPRVESIITAACEVSGITRGDLLGPRRARHLSRPRQVAMLACVNLAHHASLPQIGRAFGRRDHTTVMHGARNAAVLIGTNPDLRAIYDGIVAKVTTAPRFPHPSPRGVPTLHRGAKQARTAQNCQNSGMNTFTTETRRGK